MNTNEGLLGDYKAENLFGSKPKPLGPQALEVLRNMQWIIGSRELRQWDMKCWAGWFIGMYFLTRLLLSAVADPGLLISAISFSRVMQPITKA